MLFIVSKVGGIQARVCLKWLPSWLVREHHSINQGRVWGPDSRAGAGTLEEGCHLLHGQGMKKGQEPGAGEAAHPNPCPYFPP